MNSYTQKRRSYVNCTFDQCFCYNIKNVNAKKTVWIIMSIKNF